MRFLLLFLLLAAPAKAINVSATAIANVDYTVTRPDGTSVDPFFLWNTDILDFSVPLVEVLGENILIPTAFTEPHASYFTYDGDKPIGGLLWGDRVSLNVFKNDESVPWLIEGTQSIYLSAEFLGSGHDVKVSSSAVILIKVDKKTHHHRGPRISQRSTNGFAESIAIEQDFSLWVNPGQLFALVRDQHHRIEVQPAIVPLPAHALMLGAGLLALWRMRQTAAP